VTSIVVKEDECTASIFRMKSKLSKNSYCQKKQNVLDKRKGTRMTLVRRRKKLVL
jgi:hypothetical protein